MIDYTFEDLPGYIDRLMPKLHIAVVYGGNKRLDGATIYQTPNTRPWKSYEAVANDIQQALKTIGFRYVICLPDDMRLIRRLQKEKIDLVWLNTGGMQGYNPVAHAPSMLEMIGLPYVGHNPLITTLLDNKHCFKRELEGLGVPTAPFMVWDNTKGDLDPKINYRFRRAFEEYRGPFVAKPTTGRASLHVHMVENIEELPGVVRHIYEQTRNHVLIERFVGGREFCIGVCGPVIARNGRLEKIDTPFVFSEIERIYAKDERIFVSMDKRPITEKRARLLNRATESDRLVVEQLQRVAKNIYLDFDLTTLVRIDARADEDGNLFVLEANPKPDLKRFEHGVISLIAMGLTQQRMIYEDIILSLFAETLDKLFATRQPTIGHVTALLR